MKKIFVIVLTGLTAASLGACTASQEESGNQQIEETAVSEVTSEEGAAIEEVPQASTQEVNFGIAEQVTETVPPQEQELDDLLEEIHRDGRVGAAGCSLTAVRLAAHLMNWGVGTPLTTDQIKKVTNRWFQGLDEEQQAGFKDNMNLVRRTYEELLGENAEELLDEAGCREEAAYPWSAEPIETVEAVMQVILGE